MYLTAMPCPPLPILVESSSSSGKNGDQHYSNTHDLIAALVVMAMDRGNRRLNEQRKAKQLALNEELICALEQLPAGDDGSGAFAACQRFVGGYIHAFDDPGEPTPSVRLVGLETVQNGDKVHEACSRWSAAQDIQHEPVEARRRTSAVFGRLTYREMLVEHTKRVTAVSILPMMSPTRDTTQSTAEKVEEERYTEISLSSSSDTKEEEGDRQHHRGPHADEEASEAARVDGEVGEEEGGERR